MAFSYDDVLKSIKSGELKNIYYFCGRDVMSVESLARQLIKKISNGDESSYQKFIGKELNISEFADYCEMFPMSADYNLIVINDLNAEEFSADEIKSFLDILENVPPSTVVLIYITGIDIKGGKKYPTAKNKKITDFTAKNGVFCEMELKTPQELGKSAMKLAEKLGCPLNRYNAEKIVQLCLCNSLMIKNEVEKLCSYADGMEITADMIDALVPKQLDSTVFNLAKAVTSFNVKQSLLLLDEVFLQQNDAINVLGSITGAFIDFYRAKAAVSCRRSENDVINDFSYKGREFVVRNSFRDCRKISDSHMKKCLNILKETDKALKTFSGNDRIIIEQAVVRMAVREI